MQGIDIPVGISFLVLTMNSETTGDAPKSDSKTVQVELPKTHFCQKCGAQSDGLGNCLHVNTTVGAEIRCLACYREFVQSETHLEAIKTHIPIMVRIPLPHEEKHA